MMEFDADAASRVEAAYTTPDIVAQRDRVRAALALEPGEQVLDVGVGPGFLAAEMAAEVGPDGRVCGIDTSAAMMDVAARRNPGAQAATLALELGGVERIPYADESFDAVVTTQVLEYVADIPGALAEMRRVLRPGGRLLVLDTDWDSLVWHAPDEELMARVLDAWEGHLADPHLPRSLGRSPARGGVRGRTSHGAAPAQRRRSARQLQRIPPRPGRRLRRRPERAHQRGGGGLGRVDAGPGGGLVLQPQPVRVPGEPPLTR